MRAFDVVMVRLFHNAPPILPEAFVSWEENLWLNDCREHLKKKKKVVNQLELLECC